MCFFNLNIGSEAYMLTLKCSLLFLLLVCLVITRYHEIGFRQNLQEIHPSGLPDLSKPSRTQKNFRENKMLDINLFTKPGIVIEYFYLSIKGFMRAFTC